MKRLLTILILFCSVAALAQPTKRNPAPFDKSMSAYTQQNIQDTLFNKTWGRFRDSLFTLGTGLSYSNDTLNAASITDTLIIYDTIVVGGKQIITGRNSSSISGGTTRYVQLDGNAAVSTTDPTDTAQGGQYTATFIPIPGTFRNVRATHFAVLNADTVTFTLFKNGAATAITFFITGDTKVGGDNTHSVAVVEDDLLAWRITATSGTSFQGAYSLEFDPD